MLLLFGIVGFCLAARTDRLSSQGNGHTERRLEVNQIRSYYTDNGFLSPENSFTLKIECGPWNQDKCSSANQTIKNVTIKIANEILLREPISISIQVDSNTKLASFGNTFRTIAAQKVDSRGTGANYSYPQALVKQASVDALPRDAINHILTYAFESDISFKIGSKIFDPLNDMREPTIGNLEMIVAQMITYSLGIQTQFEIFRGPGYDFLAPTQERRYFSSLITPFDALIHERESCGFPNCASVEKQLSFKKAAELFNGINVTLWSKEQCIQAIRNNKTILDTATKLRQLQNSNRLELRFSDGSRVSIEHFKGMYYLGRKYKNSADFILAHLHSVKLSDKLSSLKIESVYGPIGLKILEELGYATRGRPEVLRLNMKGSLATIDN